MTTKNIIITIGIIIIALGGINIISNKKAKSEKENKLPEIETREIKNTEIQQTENIKADVSESLPAKTAGTYEVYSPEKIAWAKDKKVILFFKASWCPTCRSVDKDIKANLENIPSDVAILEVDYDNSQELKQKYGVTYQHTFVQVDENGGKLAKWSGSPTLSSLLKEEK